MPYDPIRARELIHQSRSRGSFQLPGGEITEGLADQLALAGTEIDEKDAKIRALESDVRSFQERDRYAPRQEPRQEARQEAPTPVHVPAKTLADGEPANQVPPPLAAAKRRGRPKKSATPSP